MKTSNHAWGRALLIRETGQKFVSENRAIIDFDALEIKEAICTAVRYV